MSDKLYWSTVTPLLKRILCELMEVELLKPFRLVGGTSLSLQLGHRSSVDIDLFTGDQYDSIDFNALDDFLRYTYTYVSNPTPGLVGLGRSYILGDSETDSVKLDLYYVDPFIRPELMIEGIRMATMEEVAAMKVDVVQRGGRKKDFWDIHEMMDRFPIGEMISLHETRYPYGHDEALIRRNFVDFSLADEDFEPVCLKGKYWELIKLDIIRALS